MGSNFQENPYKAAAQSRLEETLSLERFARYAAWAGQERERAFHLYALNTQLSEALYTPLQMLEVALRNRCHSVLSARYGAWWFDQKGFLKAHRQPVQVEKAKADVRRGGKEVTEGRVVAALTFGFWTAMLSPKYDTLWQQELHRIASTPEGKRLPRKSLSEPLRDIRELRNRIAHHEPILSRDLCADHAGILRLTALLCPDAAAWSDHHSRFAAVYPAEGIALEGFR